MPLIFGIVASIYLDIVQITAISFARARDEGQIGEVEFAPINCVWDEEFDMSSLAESSARTK